MQFKEWSMKNSSNSSSASSMSQPSSFFSLFHRSSALGFQLCTQWFSSQASSYSFSCFSRIIMSSKVELSCSFRSSIALMSATSSKEFTFLIYFSANGFIFRSFNPAGRGTLLLVNPGHWTNLSIVFSCVYKCSGLWILFYGARGVVFTLLSSSMFKSNNINCLKMII